MSRQTTYVGLDNDEQFGMTRIGTLVRDAQVFGIIPETETCAGWSMARMQTLSDAVAKAWDENGHLPSKLPEELRERHQRIHGEALRRAKEQGWEPPMDDD